MTTHLVRPVLTIAFATIAVFGAGSAAAEPTYTPEGFRSPSGNITCVSGGGAVACEINDHAYANPPRPEDCHGSYGDRLAMRNGAIPIIVCHNDTIRDESLPILSYGEAYVRGDLRCVSSTSDVTCTNTRTYHAFTLSRDSYDLR